MSDLIEQIKTLGTRLNYPYGNKHEYDDKELKEIIQLVKEAVKEKIEALEIDSRSASHMINGFLIAKAEAAKAVDEL